MKRYETQKNIVGRRSSLRKTSSIRRLEKRRTITGDPKGQERGKGDIYTKVAIPRSKSFMNVSGQYNLQELFKELKEKEGIESVDDILREVVSSGGMSFNKIKPVYRYNKNNKCHLSASNSTSLQFFPMNMKISD